MKKLLFTLSFMWFAGLAVRSQVSDVDGNRYRAAHIGAQQWLLENLNVGHFRNGDIILEAQSWEAWSNAYRAKQPAWCYAKPNDPNSVNTLHKLYNWYAVHDARGLAPDGWHVPSNSEWSDLTGFLGGDDVAGIKMRSTRGWINRNGTNESGFSGLPGNMREIDGQFPYVDGSHGNFWSSTGHDAQNAWYRQLSVGFDNVYKAYGDKGEGYSVRCIKD
jgi:uncharacterized protein (TIGR02145 family)